MKYKYHERDDNGEYNREETKELRRNVGDPYDEVTMDRLASAIMAQMARRDIWVVDVEVYEFSRKPINFRETRGGIILKNRKFLLDDATFGGQQMDVPVAEHIADEQPHVVHSNPNPVQPNGMHPHNEGQLRPIDWVIFQPELPSMPEVRQKGLRFTVDRKYPVYHKQPHPTGIGFIYKMMDDSNREQLVSDKYFIPASMNLEYDQQAGFSQPPEHSSGGTLAWGGAVHETDMIDVRRT